MKHIADIFTALMLLLNIVSLQQAEAYVSTDTTKDRPVIEAVRVANPIKVDGILSEAEWQRPGETRFTQRDPNEGSQPTQKTEVWVAYDDAALYVAARMYDSHPDSIISRIGRRDADLSADAFYVGIDSYHDRRTGYYFAMYCGGTMVDGTMYNDSWDDNSWDGVWDVATTVDDKGWTAEMRIPYSQLRFPKQDEYVWGINFFRQIQRNNERDDFVMVPKKESGWVSRFADLVGIRNINPPQALEVTPYVVSSGKFLQHEPGDPFTTGHDFSQDIGADVKLGIGNNLTLNATFNPDFGQVEVDPAVVNLTQYETYFNEKRPFFVEGSNLLSFGFGGANSNWGFNWGTPEFFYSRRIGRPPAGSVQHKGFSEIIDRTHIIGAGKLTGKISEGWSIAAVQAFTARQYAQTDSAGVRFNDVVEPFTYYGVVRSLREFNDGNRAVGFIGTATIRDLSRNYLVDQFNRRAFSLGVDSWTNLDEDKTWVATGWLGSTRIEGSPARITSLQESSLHYYQRPDADYVKVDPTATSLTGYAGRIALNKQRGNAYLNASFGFVSPGFDVSDLGYQYPTDRVNMHLVMGYRWFEPDGIFRQKSFNVATYRSYNFGNAPFGFPFGDQIKTGEGYFLFTNATFMNYWGFSATTSYSPAVYDLTRTRGGPMMKTTRSYNLNLDVWTDSRQVVWFDVSGWADRAESGGYEIGGGSSINWKPASNVSASISPSIDHNRSMAQWVQQQDDPTATETFGARYVFATLDQKEIAASIRLDWTFTPKLTLQLYLQPLVSVGRYSGFKELRQPGTFTFNQYDIDNGSSISFVDSSHSYVVAPNNTGASSFTIDNPDFNFKSLRGNAVLRWEYLPGSTLYLVWTQQRTNSNDPGNLSFGRDLGNLLSGPSDNVFMVKVSYWWNP